MEPSAIVALLKDGGGWGVAALAISWAIYERRGHNACQAERVKTIEIVTAALIKAELAIISVTAALESRKGYFETLGALIESFAREIRQELQLIRQSMDDRRGGRS